MTYQQALEQINSRLRFGIKPGLERVARLLEQMGNPQEKLKFVHVAGTNGKGTTCTLVSSVLKSSGYKTGLFISPYVTDFCERFQINGEMIQEQELAKIMDRINPLVEKIEQNGDVITEFELITALAFQWFADQKCDVVVLEVGLGGRFDATNVIKTPLVSVIASISLDHTAILGDTVEQIAFEKCGIVKQNGTTILYPEQKPEVFEVVTKITSERNNRLLIADLSQMNEESANLFGTALLYKGKKLHLPFIGEHQKKNAITALTVLEVLMEMGFVIPAQAVEQGFANAKIPARMEILSENPIVLLDGGHNPGCAAALAAVLKKYMNGKKMVAVMGMMADKDSRTALSYIAPLFSAIITLQPENPRSMTSEELAKNAAEFCKVVYPMQEKKLALNKAVDLAGEDGVVVICGSFYLAGEIRPLAQQIFSKQK